MMDSLAVDVPSSTTLQFFARASTEANNVSWFACGLFKRNQSYQLIHPRYGRFAAIVLLQSMFFVPFLFVEIPIAAHINGRPNPFPFPEISK
jgi:hypothetical protein